MFTEKLVSKQGPLGHVWLAANYDKKLTKQQLLSTSITKSSDFISNHPISYSVSQSQSGTEPTNSITLRLSGQLLLGIVRIYSRKTKYLLDDVNDILLKLKTSFKYASGGIKLGSDLNSSKINLKPQDTVISNVRSITLQDQVTRFDLLYQDDLNLDDDVAASQGRGLFNQANINDEPTEDSFTFDQSIEYGRYDEPQDPTTPGNDYGLELDFDLDLDDDNNNDSDHSIEIGRDASQLPQNNPEISLVDLNKDTDFDLGDPIDTIDDHPGLEADNSNNVSDQENEPTTPPSHPPRPRTKRNRITEDGDIITTNRKLKIDSLQDLEGLSIQSLKENQQAILHGDGEELTFNLTETEKLQLIYELSGPNVSNKRRKLWNIDTQLQEKCLELSRKESELEEQHNLQFEQDFNDLENMDFDLSLPDFDDQPESPEHNEQIEDDHEHEDEDLSNENAARSTTQVSSHLRELFTDNQNIDLADLIAKDLKITDTNPQLYPLGTVSKGDSTKVNRRKEATKCFFELLVLATNDCIAVKQETQETKIGGDISISSRDRLFTSFL